MTYASAIAATHAADIHLTLLFDGIPVLFGTKAGLIHPLTGVVTNAPAGGLTSVDAIIEDSVSLGGTTLNMETLQVPPSDGSISIRIDSAWNKWFERRRGAQPTLTTLITELATHWGVTSSGGIAEGDLVYINRETCLVTATTSDTIDVTRNYCALPVNKAAVHMPGATVSTVPRHLMGRFAELRVWAGDDPADSRVLKYLRLVSSPSYNRNEGAWSFDFSDTMEVFDRRICIGFRGSRVASMAPVYSGTGVSTMVYARAVPQENAREFGPADSEDSEPSHMLIRAGQDGCILPISGFSDDDEPHLGLFSSTRWWQTLRGLGDDAVADYDDGGISGEDYDLEMRRVHLFTGPPMVAALQVLLSDAGGLVNHATYDVLFGLTSTAATVTGRLELGETECRFGAAVPAALVEIPTGDILHQTSPGWFRVIGANGEENLLEFLEDVAWALKGYWYVNADQKLAFKQFEAQYAIDNVVATITEDDILEGTPLVSLDDESGVLSTVSIECNHSPVTGKFHGVINAYYPEQKETYREIAGSLRLKRRSLAVALPLTNATAVTQDVPVFPTDLDTLRIELDRIFSRRAFDQRRWTLHLPWKFSTLECGDRVRFTYDQMNAFDGTTVTSMTAEVVGITRDFVDGSVVVELQEVFTGAKLLAPTAEVASWAGTTATLETNTKWGGGTTPGTWFAVGWKVVILQASASPPFSVSSNVLTVDAVTNTSLELTGAVGFVPADGDIITLAPYDNSDSTALNAAQSLSQRQYLFQGDASGQLGASNTEGDVWA